MNLLDMSRIHKADIDKIKTQKKHTVTTVVTTVSSKHGATTSHSHVGFCRVIFSNFLVS